MSDPEPPRRGKKSEVSRFGKRTGQACTFTCAKCLKTAATIDLVDGNEAVGFGPGPDGQEMMFSLHSPAGSIRLTWLGVSLQEASQELTELLSSDEDIDPLDLAHRDWELGAFCCRRCQLNYCSSCWKPWPVFADDYPGWHEETRGRCPEGHEQRLED